MSGKMHESTGSTSLRGERPPYVALPCMFGVDAGIIYFLRDAPQSVRTCKRGNLQAVSETRSQSNEPEKIGLSIGERLIPKPSGGTALGNTCVCLGAYGEASQVTLIARMYAVNNLMNATSENRPGTSQSQC